MLNSLPNLKYLSQYLTFYTEVLDNFDVTAISISDKIPIDYG